MARIFAIYKLFAEERKLFASDYEILGRGRAQSINSSKPSAIHEPGSFQADDRGLVHR